MNLLVSEYRSFPQNTDHLPDDGINSRKCEIIRELDGVANEVEVSQLLLDVLRNVEEHDLARVEAIQVVGLYINGGSFLCAELRAEVRRIFQDDSEDEMLRGWAEGSVKFFP